MRRKRSSPPLHHGDPVIEQQLEHIRLLRRLISGCEEQIALYRKEIKKTHDQDGWAGGASRHNEIYTSHMKDLLQAQAARRQEAERSIEAQHAQVKDLHAQLIERMQELSPADLAYL